MRRTVAMVVLVLAAGALSILRDDRLAGFGRDGEGLGRLAASLERTPPWEVILDRVLRPDSVHRALPALVVAGVQETAGVPRTDENVRQGFQVLNLVCLVGAAALWGSVAMRLGLPALSAWLGLLLLFLNFAMAKAAWAEATTADCAAFAVGMATLRAHLARRGGWLLACAALAALVSPALFAASLILWAMRGAESRGEIAVRDARWWGGVLAGAGLLGLVCAHALHLFRPLRQSMPVDQASIGIAAFLVVVWLGLGARFLLEGAALPRLERRRVVVAVGIYLLVEIAVRGLSRVPFYPVPYAHAIYHSVARAGLFFVAHVAWLGPIFLLTLLRWCEVAAAVRAQGPGMVAVFLLLLVEGIDPQSRLLVWGLPFVVAFTLAAVPVDGRIFALLAGGAFVASRVWFTLGLEDTVVSEGIGDHVRQHYFMANGPYMHPDGYALQGALILHGFLLLWLLLRRREAA
jgi:hypothetical protein